MTSETTPDTEIALACGQQRALVSPWGASLRRYYVVEGDGSETDIVWGYSGGAHKRGGQGDVLIPFPGRVAEGRYSFDGRQLQLERNDKEGPNAIHGFVRTLPWTTQQTDSNSVAFEVQLEAANYTSRGYPFSLSIRVTYGLDAQGLACAFAVQNVGRQAAPVGVGFHPYFTVGTALVDEVDVKIPATGYLEFNERLVPTGRVLDAKDTEWDYRNYCRVGNRRLNHCYVGLERDADRMATASLRHQGSGRRTDILMDRSFSAIVVYTGDAIADAPRRALAIEPMTCATDAFNHPEWGLTRLLPDETFTGRYIVKAYI
uniref:Putative aldose 1-epimerase n=1 Tax=uncultured bacterium pBE3-1 TaxID=1781161 RepID=A0A1C9U546_9BACT|nr:putative aldose 1-epimerase [uncultured bacterium pBE3-1]